MDWLQADYSVTLHDAVWRYPLPAALALRPESARRRGLVVTGPDNADQASAKARAACKQWLAEHFQILPKGEPGPDNALADWLARHSDPDSDPTP